MTSLLTLVFVEPILEDFRSVRVAVVGPTNGLAKVRGVGYSLNGISEDGRPIRPFQVCIRMLNDRGLQLDKEVRLE